MSPMFPGPSITKDDIPHVHQEIDENLINLYLAFSCI